MTNETLRKAKELMGEIERTKRSLERLNGSTKERPKLAQPEKGY